MLSKFRLIALFCWLGIASSLLAAEAPTACVWELEGAGGTKVYLAGSVHMLRAQDHPLPDIYEEAYQASDRIFFEVDLAEMEGPQAQAMILQMGMLPQGQTLQDVLKPETYKRVQAYLAKRGLGGPMFDRFNPGMMGITISAMEAQFMGATPENGVEKVFDTKARKDGKPVLALETAEFQMGLFNKLSGDDADKFLNMTLDDIEESPEKLGELIDAWKKGDTNTMDEMINESFEPDDDVAKLLLYDRNANWIPAIEKQLKREGGNTMFIVGAGHLVGKGSVIDLLEQKGYTAKQL